LGGNELGPESAIAIAEVLKSNKTITNIEYGIPSILLFLFCMCCFHFEVCIFVSNCEGAQEQQDSHQHQVRLLLYIVASVLHVLRSH
jgi:hypothetical protein